MPNRTELIEIGIHVTMALGWGALGNALGCPPVGVFIWCLVWAVGWGGAVRNLVRAMAVR
jgi:hypothetical protein